jgi:hypothetical protein
MNKRRKLVKRPRTVSEATAWRIVRAAFRAREGLCRMVYALQCESLLTPAVAKSMRTRIAAYGKRNRLDRTGGYWPFVVEAWRDDVSRIRFAGMMSARAKGKRSE